MILFRVQPAAPYSDACWAWFLSALGVVVAPLVAGLARGWRIAPLGKERIEGVGLRGLLALASSHTTTQKTIAWLSFGPSALALPLGMWLLPGSQTAGGIAEAFLACAAMRQGIGAAISFDQAKARVPWE